MFKSRYYLLLTIPVILTVLALIIIKPGKDFVFQNDSSQKPDHKQLSSLLEKYVNLNGGVDYNGFMVDSALLNKYLDELSKLPPDKNAWSKEDQVAYWINVYNAFTIKLILDHWPVSSIKDIGSSLQVPFINSPWDITFIKIAGQDLTLNDIEHRILRKEFDEPRIHFAIVCASISCPGLRREAFIGSKLDGQLNDQAIAFINDPVKNEVSNESIRLSRIFQWFGGDFKKKGTLINYLNQFSDIRIREDANKEFLEYNWGINSQENLPATDPAN